MDKYDGSRLGQGDFSGFLVQAYMGDGSRLGSLEWAPYLYRAYLDLCRTLRGFGKLADKESRLQASAQYLEQRISQLAASPPASPARFDTWHATTCAGLEARMRTWPEGGAMHRGQSQKWVNMSLKYLFTALALGLVPDFAGAASSYRYAHLPLDRYVLTGLAIDGCDAAKGWSDSWSTLDSRSYEAIQEWCRCRETAPLDLDWVYWSRRSGVPLTSASRTAVS